MGRTTLFAALALLTFGVAACGDDEDPTGPGEEQDEIVGTWVSTGADLAPGLAAAPFNADSIIATFNENGTYAVVQWSAGAAINFAGTYTLGTQAEGQIRAITANQTAPTSVTSQGIFQVTGATMRYEIIQVEPAIQGVTAPTVAGGFGSTAVNGTPTGAYWVQNYDRRN